MKGGEANEVSLLSPLRSGNFKIRKSSRCDGMRDRDKDLKRERMNAYMREYNRRPEVKAQMRLRRIERKEKIFNEFIAYLYEMDD